MTLRQLEYLVAVVDDGSISGAAEKLNISQPPLSMQIKALEEEFGVILFERSTRYIRPTDACLKLYERARTILDIAAAAQSELTLSEDHLEGRLIIGTISSCGNVVLAPEMVRFTRRYPDVHFELVEGNTYSLLDKLKKREIDLAFVRTPFDHDGLEAIPLSNEPICAVGMPELLPEGGAISLLELSRCPLIIYRRFESMYRKAFRQAHLPMNVRCLNDDARTTLMWAGAGTGVGLVPKSIVSLISKPGLVVRDIALDGFTTQVNIVYRKGQYLPPAAEKFIGAYTDKL